MPNARQERKAVGLEKLNKNTDGMALKDEILRLAASAILVKGTVDEATAEKRMQACLGCDKRIEAQNKCGACGCYLDLKTKTSVNRNIKKMRNEITHCPLGKWDDKDTANIYREIDGLAPLQ